MEAEGWCWSDISWVVSWRSPIVGDVQDWDVVPSLRTDKRTIYNLNILGMWQVVPMNHTRTDLTPCNSGWRCGCDGLGLEDPLQGSQWVEGPVLLPQHHHFSPDSSNPWMILACLPCPSLMMEFFKSFSLKSLKKNHQAVFPTIAIGR